MIISLTNQIPADELASHYGIINPIISPTSSDIHIPLDLQRAGDGCFCVTGLLYLGAGTINGDIVGIYKNSNQTEKHVANISEKISLFVPIELTDPTSRLSNFSSSKMRTESWIMKSTEKYLTSSTSTAVETDTIFEMFTSMSYANHCLMIEMNKSREKLKETQNGSNENQPRSISQVRRDRNGMKTMSSSFMNDDSNEQMELLDGINLVTYDELKRGQLTLGISWITYWKGKVHHGISLLHHQQILKYHNTTSDISTLPPPPLLPPPSLVTKSSIATQNQLSDVITVGFNHHQSLTWDFNHGRCPVAIMVLIHSIHPTQSFVISVEALEWLDMMTTKALNRRKRPPLKGLHWEGKSRYIDLTLPPMSTISLPFLALVSRKGVYNIKRFSLPLLLILHLLSHYFFSCDLIDFVSL
jgi:hypothetical protein